MAGTVTLSTHLGDVTQSRSADARFNRYALAWTSDSSGNATYTTATIEGTLCKVEFVPSGTAAPTDLYDVTLTDSGGVDVLAGQGANLSATVATAVVPGVPMKDGTTTSTAPCVLADPLSLSVSNAGNAKQGQVILYVR